MNLEDGTRLVYNQLELWYRDTTDEEFRKISLEIFERYGFPNLREGVAYPDDLDYKEMLRQTRLRDRRARLSKGAKDLWEKDFWRNRMIPKSTKDDLFYDISVLSIMNPIQGGLMLLDLRRR